MQIKLGIINKISIKRERDSFIICNITVTYEDGFFQNICGIVLDEYDEKLNKRTGTTYGGKFISKLFDTLDVPELSDANGSMIYVFGEGKNLLDFRPKGFISNGKKHKLMLFSNPDEEDISKLCIDEVIDISYLLK